MARRPLLVLAVVAAWTAGGLWLERSTGPAGQLALGVLTVCVLAGLLVLHSPRERLQTALVVCVASAAEVVGSLLWGLYAYRLDNLPAFVPPGHGLVYLAGLALAQAARAREARLVQAAAVALAAWGALSLLLAPTPDVAGAIGCATLLAVLARTGRPVYAGVFFVVAVLELYGTALGTWTWAPAVPGLGLPQANPPSGVASGYVLFDVLALAAAPRLARLARRLPLPAPLRPSPT